MRDPDWKTADGRIRLYLGDALDLLSSITDCSVVVTDPPYGIGWTRGANPANPRGASKAHKGIAGDQDTSARDEALRLTAGLPAVVFGSFYAPFPVNLKQILVWQKPPDAGLVGSVTGFRRDAEPIFLVGPWPTRTCKASSVFRTTRGQASIVKETGHPHTKPVDLIVELLGYCPDGGILDPFMGSGTSGVASILAGRPFVGIELDEKYFDVSVKRIESAMNQYSLFEKVPKVVMSQKLLFARSD